MDDTLRKIEALLFLAGEAVSYKELAQLIGQSVESAKDGEMALAQAMQDHGLTITATDTHAQLTTSMHVTEYLQKFLQGEAQHLSAAAAETLAIIAYRGPITRLDIEAIRGVDSRRMLRQLTARGLIRRRKLPDKLPHYSVAEEFLQHLGLTTLQQLPRYDELHSHEKIEQLLERPLQ